MLFNMQDIANGGPIEVRYHRGRERWQVWQDNTPLYTTESYEAALEVAGDLAGLAGCPDHEDIQEALDAGLPPFIDINPQEVTA